jgi:hypothetical protein
MPIGNDGFPEADHARIAGQSSSAATAGWAAFRDIVFRLPTFTFLGRRTEEYGLSDRQSADSSERAAFRAAGRRCSSRCPNVPSHSKNLILHNLPERGFCGLECKRMQQRHPALHGLLNSGGGQFPSHSNRFVG